MKVLRKTIAALALALLPALAFADAAEPRYNDYFPIVSYMIVAGIGIVIIIAVVVLARILIRRRRMK